MKSQARLQKALAAQEEPAHEARKTEEAAEAGQEAAAKGEAHEDKKTEEAAQVEAAHEDEETEEAAEVEQGG